MSIAKFSVRNPVFVNLVMAGLICFGAICLFNMPQELNPQIDFNWVMIAIPYPGASPEEVESLIVDPIEAEIHDLDKIDELNSQASEGLGHGPRQVRRHGGVRVQGDLHGSQGTYRPGGAS